MKYICKLTNEELVCTELCVKDYKDLLKSVYGDNPSETIFIETLCDIFSSITNKPKEYFKKLSVIDFFCLLLELRINSQGNICKIILNNEKSKANIELKLDLLKQDLLQKSIVQQFINFNNLEIVLRCPSIEDLAPKVSENYASFIKKVSVRENEHTISFEISDTKQSLALIEKLSPKVYVELTSKCKELYTSIINVNFLDRYRIKNQRFVFEFSIEYLVWFAKLIFNESLETLFDNIFYLSHISHINPTFIENSTVGEYNYFIKRLNQTLAINQPPDLPSNNPVDESLDL